VAGAAVLGRLNWQLAEVLEIVDETPRVRSIVLRPPSWPGHLAGQHVDVRLTAEDGYQAQRSYSIASAPEDTDLLLTIERLEDGEVSSYLFDVLHPGDQLELRGPIGGYFVWQESMGGPLLLLAGGSGVVPFRAMLRHHAATASSVPVRLLYSSRSYDRIIYREELTRLGRGRLVEVFFTLTREWPDDWDGHRRRIDGELLGEISWPPSERPKVYVCGSNPFVEQAANALLALGHDAMAIRTERFGPTGA
jgi:ferredoxin-NADP reductase